MKRSGPLERRTPLSDRGKHEWETVEDDGLFRVLECDGCDRRWRGFVDEHPPEGPCNSLSRSSGLERSSGPRPVSDRRDEKRPDLGTELEDYVEGLPCLLADHPEHTCEGDVVAHHVRHKNHAGDWTERGGRRVGNLVPLCAIGGHQDGPESVHVMGRDSFEARWGVDLAEEAERIGERFREEREAA